ncbi:hypothetical protein GGR52DRAFT_417804 [Hypoxylon sp. FL1284]|nr:hypothetical protein GGR52DRAFT_417804 [Hypoxylon sp. FL1284]
MMGSINLETIWAFLGIHFGYTWVNAYATLDVLSRDENGDNREARAKTWIRNKTKELNFLALIGTFIASIVVSSFSWPAIENTHWMVEALWYNSLTMAIVSAVMAFQQSSSLGCALAKVETGHNLLPVLLQREQKNKQKKPSHKAVFVLQAPVQLLSYSVLAYFIGLLVLIFYPLAKDLRDQNSVNIAIFYGSFIPCYIAFYFVTSSLSRHVLEKVQQAEGLAEGKAEGQAGEQEERDVELGSLDVDRRHLKKAVRE